MLNDLDDFHNFYILEPNIKEILLLWVSLVIIPAKTYNNETSYGLKHDFQRDASFYIDNGTLKGALFQSGYPPKYFEDQNWVFKIAPAYSWKGSRWVGFKRIPKGFDDNGKWIGLFQIPEKDLVTFNNCLKANL
jgi:hypothetical protein